jgi:uncharacterized membrane protein YeaQ/YmgE (transglycosylase-associated protein family)
MLASSAPHLRRWKFARSGSISSILPQFMLQRNRSGGDLVSADAARRQQNLVDKHHKCGDVPLTGIHGRASLRCYGAAQAGTDNVGAKSSGGLILESNSLIVILIVGLIAGWLAGKIMRGSGFGIIGDLIVGIIGAFIGTWLWGALHLPTIANFWINAIVIATVGAIILLFILRLIRR